MSVFKIIFYALINLFVIFPPYSLANKSEATCAITCRQEGGRLGDDVYAYVFAKWLSYKYDIHFYATPFNNSDAFAINTTDSLLSEEIKNTFTNIINIQNEDELIQSLRTCTKPTLFTIGFGTGPDYASFLVENFQWPDLYTNMFYRITKHHAFAAYLKKSLVINDDLVSNKICLPQDKITVAVHIRKGSGNDLDLRSIQYNDECEQIINHKIRREGPLRGSDTIWPLKFPPEQYYVDQIIKLSNLLSNVPLFVYVFTDDKDPNKIVKRLKKRVTLPNITFSCRQGDVSNVHCNQKALMEDIWNMAQFDCLIKTQSSLSMISQLIGNTKIIIYPRDSKTRAEPALNQLMLTITDVSIIFYNQHTKFSKFLPFNSVTDEHKKIVPLVFKG